MLVVQGERQPRSVPTSAEKLQRTEQDSRTVLGHDAAEGRRPF